MPQPLRIAVMPGDGIGPEVVTEAVHCLESLREKHQLPIEWSRFPWPSHAWHEQYGEVMPADALALLGQYDAILLGALGDPGPLDDPERHLLPDSVSLAPLLEMRKGFDQWVCERPARLLPGARQYLADDRARDIDMLVIRENSEAEARRHEGRKREFPSQAGERGESQVCIVTKRNALRYWGDMYTEVFNEIARDYPDVATHHELIDAACMKFVQSPWAFDVVVASNLQGDILTDLAAVLSGGMGVAPSCNLNPDNPNMPSMFEPTHGSAPDIAGQGIADPTAMLFTTARMLEWLGRQEPLLASAGRELFDAVAADLAQNGGSRRNTRDIGDSVLNRLK